MNHPGIYYLIFAVSGFAGLIYESIWTHYLKLFLGHAAYSQTLVLAIFMGGMALGAAICSRYSRNWSNLLLWYAVVEGIIGIFALIYHPLFDAGINYAYATIIPSIGSLTGVTVFKWIISTISILPQSILLGMTFPLMSGAFLRLFPKSSGNSLSMLYFSNSIGAVFGVLASGFILIRAAGFPGTIQMAGVINIAIAIAVWYLSRDLFKPSEPITSTVSSDQLSVTPQRSYRLLLLISLGTGVASFIYEIGWIRMLSLVLGSSTHAFELMLSAFLLGLAFGGLWIKRRIDSLTDPVRTLAIIQMVMGLLALSTLPLYDGTFGIMQWLMRTLPKSDNGYLLFNLGSYGIAAAIMLPATFCAGMTLPLITNILFSRGHGEKSVGAVYAANTVGAIIGVFWAVHLGMPLLGLKGLLASGVAIDLALGILLIWRADTDYRNRQVPAVATFVCVAAVVLVVVFVRLDPYKMASGIYRTGTKFMTHDDISLIFHKDGKTSTVSVTLDKFRNAGIKNNGKPDSAINLDINSAYAPDEPTTIMAGALPFFYKPDAAKVANIGLGTGLTTQTILTNPKVQRADTIEIEKAVVEAGQLFRSRTDLVYSDPRSNIIIDDAKSAFSSHGRKYDIIISEPSNPWVSGVAGLFSEEFYRHVKRYLEDDGLFVQWIQLYEMDLNLVASIFKAISNNFSDYTVYLTAGNADLMIVAKKKGPLGQIKADAFQFPAFRSMLSRININGLQDIHIREVGTKRFLEPLFNSYPIKSNSDYFPVLDQNSAKARFMNTGAFSLLGIANGPIPFMRLMTEDPGSPPISKVSIAEGCDMTHLARRGVSMKEYILTGKFPKDADAEERIVSEVVRNTAMDLRKMILNCNSFSETDRKELLSTAAIAMIPYLTPEEIKPVWNEFERSSCLQVMSAIEKKYLELFKALSLRNFRSVSVIARELLANDRQMPQHTTLYIVGIGMLASIANGNPAEANELYSQAFGSKGYPDIIFRLLYAQTRL